MKTFVLFLISWLTWFGNEPKNTADVRKSAASETCGSAPVVGGSFQVIAGDIVYNDFKKVLYHSYAYYAIGSRDNHAALSKFDDMGTLLWTRVVDDTSAWNDFIVNTDGNLLLVGWRDIQSFAPKDALVGVIEPSGNPLVLQSFDYTINEYYSSIVRNPLNTAPGYRYYVVGSINRTTNRNDDDVVVVAMNDQGVASARRRYGSISRDDEFHAKISVYNPVAGTFALSGNLGGTATYVVINPGPGTTTNQGRALGATGTLFDLQRTASGEYLGAAGFTSAGRIYKISGTAANNFYYESNVVSGLHQILSMDASGFYTVGKAVVGGNPKPVTMFCRDNGSNLTLYAAKYPLICDNPGAGFLARVGLTDLAYVDGRINAVDGFGNGDGYLAAHIGGFDDCEMDSLPGNFQKRSLNPVISQPGSYPEVELVSGLALSSSLINYSVARVCDHSCFTEFTYELEDDCGNVHFTGTTNLTGSVTYCWDFGDAPPCGSTLQDPDHTYASPGMYQVCLTVANGLNQCTTCQSVVVQQADHIAPDITCPPAITLACDDITTPDRSGYPTVSDNLDPAPVVSYNDLIVVMTSCYKEITRVWTAVDYCGNSANCQQRIVQSDDYGPVVNCPPSVTIDCAGDRSPAATGFPFVLIDCNGYSQTYADNVISGPCPQRIEREWTLTDDCGNSTVCLQEIIITDLTPPVFSECSRKFTAQGLNIEGGPCQAEISINTPIAFDDCDPAPVITNNYNNTSNASGTYPEGTTLVTWTATDECGNTATCVDTVCVLPCAACPDTCLTDIIPISTGYDPIDEILLPPGSTTSQWTLVESPLWGGGGSAPSYVINSIADWDDITGSQWLSAHPFADWTQNNPDPLIPYTFQNCFCVCQDSTLVGIKISEALADDAMDVCLVDENGILIENLLSISSSGSDDHTPFNGTVEHSSSHTFILDEGKYCIQAKLRNLHGVAMGFNILGKVFGVGLLGSACCEQRNFVTGYKFIDKKCDGVRDAGIDMPGINWKIELKNEDGDVVSTTHTLGDGFYAFGNVPIGHYTVCEENLYGFIQSYPPSGSYEIDVLDAHTVISGLNFGNCPLDTCCYDEEAFIDVATTPVDVIRDSCMICISHPCIGWCQRLTVFWGDGTNSGYFEGIGSVEASHTYTQSGEYEICLHFEELNDNGEVCFTKDSCFAVCVQCGICANEELTLNCFGLHGDSEIPTVNGTLANHSDFYIEADNNGGYYCTGHKTYNSGSGVSLYNSDVFVYKFDKDCGKCWELSFNGMADDLNDQGLVLKHFNGGFYLGGIFASGSLVVPNGGGGTYVISNPSPGQIATFLIKFQDGVGCNSSILPTVDWGFALGNDKYRTLLSDMDTDNAGNIIITGIYTGSMNFNPLGISTLLDNNTSQDMYFAKYDGATGNLLFASHLDHGLSTATTGGVYPLGISYDPNGNYFYIAGHYSKDVDFLNDNLIDLGKGPSSAAPFVAKFTENALGIAVVWAFPISDISGTSPLPFYGVATDVEAYPGGFALSFEKYYGLGIVYDFNPRGYPFPEFNNNQTSYILRYDSDGIYQCHYTLPSNNFVNELSVDLDKNIYFIGGRNINLAFSPGSQLGYSFYNTFFGVVNNNCEAKTFDLDGNNEDAGWSITPLGGKEFAIIGRTNSVNLDADPNPGASSFYSADPSIPDIFIGKYSCECIMAPDTMDCCDKISLTAEKVDHPELMCIDSACCYSVDFYNDAGFSIKNATVNILTPGWEFGTVSVPSDLTVDSDPVSLIIENSGGNLPGGFTDGFVNFCLSGQIGSPNQQEIEFIWYEKTKSGGCIAVCRDTILTDCVAPTCASNCVQILNMEIVCDETDPNLYCLYFNVINLSPYTATELIMDVSGTGYGLYPCGSTGFFDPLEVYLGGGGLASGATSGTLCVKLVPTTPVLTPQEVCFSLGLAFGESEVCYQDSTYCYEIAPCCDPCDEVELVIHQGNEMDDSCCFSLSLLNPCANLYFNKIVVDFLPVGSDISLIQVDGGWTLTPLGSGSICLTYNAGYFPSGLLEDIIRFCYRDPVPGLIPSVTVHFFSDVSSTPPGTIVEVCSKSVEMECRCCPECEDNLVINGSFQDGLVNGNIGSPGNVNNWTALTGTPQAVDYFGSCENGAVLMWGNAIVGESIFQNVNFDPCYTYEISYCARRHFNDGQEYIGEIRMKAVTTPLPAFPACVSGNCEEIIPLPNGLTPNWEHFTVNWTPGRAYNSLIIQPWSSTTINNGANVSWVVIDDVCIRVIDSCKCENHGELLVFNDQFSVNTSCNDPAILEIPCPENNVSFNIFSDLECSSDCASSIEWNITDPVSTVIIAGIIPLPAGGGSWGISGLPYSIFTEEVLYTLNINSNCGCDTCFCAKTFKIEACDTCCGSHENFVNVAQNAIQMSVDDFKCKATLTFDEVDCDIQILSIKWLSGVYSYGPFYPGDMAMYTYPPNQMSYVVVVHVVEYNELGEICNEADLTYPVSLNCKKCCEKGIIEHKKWASLIAQGFQTNINGCEVTVTAPQFGECYFFETSPDWGEPPAPNIGPFPSNSSWTHTYSTSGTYTICVRVSEYPFGDPTLEPCRSKLMCTTVTVDCNGPCVCGGFSNLSFYYDKENKLMTECGDTLELVCPPDDCVWIFSGNLLCKNDCPESLINWQLVDSYTTIPVASGTSVAFPGFGIYIPPAIVTAGGEYDLIIIGQCDPNVICPCRIHLIFPGCDEVCPCDPDDLVNDVEAGLSTYTILNGCTACFRPLALSDCDMVTWYKLPNLNQPFASSLGNQLICYDFLTPGTHRIQMEVTRKNEDGSVCATYEKIFTLNINCGSTPNFNNALTQCLIGNDLSPFKNSNSWINIKGQAEHKLHKRGNAYVTLRGNMDQSDIIATKEAICISKSSNSIQLDINIQNANQIKLGTRLVIALLDTNPTNTVNLDNRQIIEKINLNNLPIGNIHIEQAINLEQLQMNDECVANDSSKYYIIVYLENDLNNSVLQSQSQIELYDLCLTSKPILAEESSAAKLSFRVFPNPTNDQFTFLLDQTTKEEIKIEVLDKLGRNIEQLTMAKDQPYIHFGGKYISGMYFLKVKSGVLNKQVKIVKTSK